ncbi:hypothetical protein NBO_428g0001 [Nosema bombycis CQ1]|uniref:Uncharacterized protein n=1 Tax=Nosema bombycis (strain CQ1 / CVCC 102059) TaxID=578461 RepID=R0MI66_NOSB1|nr:hypothetical protein NBO_428g0001 [Nosema bombycis CQ1]|eukprot:EOB12483.1 hypothetical protein NBO_428g0001 [Nosema bombycis CQ1]
MKSKRTMSKSSKEYKELKNREFYTIFVDMKAVEKKPEITYTFDFLLDTNEKFMTRPFHYSEENQKWELGPSESDKKNRTWMYIAGGIVAFCVIGVVVFLSS